MIYCIVTEKEKPELVLLLSATVYFKKKEKEKSFQHGAAQGLCYCLTTWARFKGQ